MRSGEGKLKTKKKEGGARELTRTLRPPSSGNTECAPQTQASHARRRAKKTGPLRQSSGRRRRNPHARFSPSPQGHRLSERGEDLLSPPPSTLLLLFVGPRTPPSPSGSVLPLGQEKAPFDSAPQTSANRARDSIPPPAGPRKSGASHRSPERRVKSGARRLR